MRALTFLGEFICAVGLVALPFVFLIAAHITSGQPGTDCIIQVEC